MSNLNPQSLTDGSLIMGSHGDNYHIECRGNIEFIRRDEATSKALDNIRDVFAEAISKISNSGDLEKLQLPKDDYMQLRLTIKHGEICYQA